MAHKHLPKIGLFGLKINHLAALGTSESFFICGKGKQDYLPVM
jgi:hypothetical protein